MLLYNAAQASTPLPGALATRGLAGAQPLDEWVRGLPMEPASLQALRGRPLTAVAGIAAPERFFGMLRAQGLSVVGLPLPDHAAYDRPPWPAGTSEVLCTEKDAAKLQALDLGSTKLWVVGLDFRLPPDFLAALRKRIAPPRRR
jgi:tetraacyldisaccharide 4'-kinase